MLMREDACHARSGAAAANFAKLRKVTHDKLNRIRRCRQCTGRCS